MRDNSGQLKKAIDRGALTSCRVQSEGQLRPAKESERAKGAHSLEGTEGRKYQDSERKPASKGHLRARSHRERDTSGQQTESERARCTHELESIRGRDKSGRNKKASARGTLTSWSAQREGQVETAKISKRVRGTHILEAQKEGQIMAARESE
jgi:hypothetical protein